MQETVSIWNPVCNLKWIVRPTHMLCTISQYLIIKEVHLISVELKIVYKVKISIRQNFKLTHKISHGSLINHWIAKIYLVYLVLQKFDLVKVAMHALSIISRETIPNQEFVLLKLWFLTLQSSSFTSLYTSWSRIDTNQLVCVRKERNLPWLMTISTISNQIDGNFYKPVIYIDWLSFIWASLIILYLMF